MKKLCLFVMGCILVILVGCHSKNEETEQIAPFPILSHFLNMVDEIQSYNTNEREQFIKDALSMKETTSSNPLFENLKSEMESIRFSETGPFLEDTSNQPLNTLTIQYELVIPSELGMQSLSIGYRFSPKIMSDNFQVSLKTPHIEDSIELSLIFRLPSSPIENVFEEQLPTFVTQTPIEMTNLTDHLKQESMSFEEHEGEQGIIYSIHDDETVLNISYDSQTQLINLLTYYVSDFEKSAYLIEEQATLSITNSRLNQYVFESDIYQKLVDYFEQKLLIGVK